MRGNLSLCSLDDKLGSMKAMCVALSDLASGKEKKKGSNFKLSPIERGRKHIPDSEMISYCTSAPRLLVNQIEML